MIETAILAAFLAFCRIGACFMLMPGLGSARLPVQVRLFVAIAASLALLAHLWGAIVPHVSRQPQAMFVLIGSEVLIGALIGLVARFYVLALQFIGSAMAMMVGFGMAGGGVAVEENELQPELAALISFSALLLLFVFDFHHAVIQALVASYELAPVDGLFDPQAALVDLSDTLSQAFLVMIRLGSPFVAYAILVNLAVGFINKLTPQIPIYFISLPFVIAGGLLLLYFGIATFLRLFVDGFLPTTIGG
ncbi:flagellar biosynthetic protein FliR [Chelativorans intermedius]|uniref:Flagellar biosynthetic protein FliR n=1 Tax=Chelativorans intermedius TaxID=515947 RepID=A0ABV6D8T1_9HYPH|nr:flagellar biosynthetic protein FliR [Chelativorans intermedius]MCT8997763.1 flagellar biosynthetic protein FliR [Chelativorans intermedius]